MSIIKKIWKFLSSMKFGLLLLLLVVAACIIGSLIPQGREFAYYIERYPARRAALIIGTCFDDVFHSPWFLILSVILCGNLLLCNLLRFPGLFRRWKNAADPEAALKLAPTVCVEGIRDPEKLFSGLGMPKAAQLTHQGREVRFSVKNRMGHWGAWVCHLGILLLVLGVILGQATKEEYVVSGLPGESVPMGDTGYTVTIDGFDVTHYDSGMPKQYTSSLTVTDPKGGTESGKARVNDPAELFGYRFYQNSTGQAARLTLTMAGTVVADRVLKAGEGIRLHYLPQIVFFSGYATDEKLGPGYQFVIYSEQDGSEVTYFQPEGQVGIDLGMLQGVFSQLQYSTVLQVKKDSWTWLVLAGGLVVLLGLVLSFYLQPVRVWAVRGEDGAWQVNGECRKGGELFARRFRQAAGAETQNGPSHEKEPAS